MKFILAAACGCVFTGFGIASAQSKYRAISVEHVWQDPQVPVFLTVDLTEKKETFELAASAEIVGPAKDAFEVAESLDKLKDLIIQKNCDSKYAPYEVVSFEYEQLTPFGTQHFDFTSPDKVSSDDVISLRLKYLKPGSAEVKAISIACNATSLTPPKQKSVPHYYEIRRVIPSNQSIEVKGAVPIHFSNNYPFELKFSAFGKSYNYKGSGFISSTVSRDTETSTFGESMTGKEIADKFCKDFDKNPDDFVFYVHSVLRESVVANGRFFGGFALSKGFVRKANAVGAIAIGIEDYGGVHPIICP